MTRNQVRSTALCAALAAASAWAAVDVEIRNGDKVTGTIFPATETETFRFRVPKDALLTVKAAAGRKGPQVRVQLKSPAGVPLPFAEGKSASISKFKAPESGLYSVEITSKDQVAAGDYSFAVVWRSAASYGGKRTLAAAAPLDVPFAADAGATATLTVKKAKKSAAAPTLATLTYPDLSVEPLTGSTQKRLLGSSGDCVLAVASATAGDVTATVKVRPPRASNRKYALTTKAIGGVGGDTAFSAIVGPLGGTVVFPDVGAGGPGEQLDGTSVLVPAGALPVGTSIVIATAPEILTGTGTGVAAGPAVAFGPEGLRFDAVVKTATATITIPFDPAFGSMQDQITIYTRNAKGVVTAVPKPYTFDLAAQTVSFASSHFSSFQAVAAGGFPFGNFQTVADVGDPRDVCAAFDPDPETTTPIFVYVAEGLGRTVGAVRFQPTGTFVRQQWAGGGAVTTLPTHRLQFNFGDDVTSVHATFDGVVYAATSTRIFRIEPSTGLVTVFAGTGSSGDGGDGGPPTSATFTFIKNIVADPSGNLYVVDAGRNRNRVVDVQSTPIVLAFAGTGEAALGQDDVPAANTTFLGPDDLAVTFEGVFYVADRGRIRRIEADGSSITTVAGDSDGSTGSTGDGGAPSSARFRRVAGVSQLLDPVNPTDEIVVVADSDDHVLRIVNFTKNTVTLLAGEHGTFGFNGDAGNVPGLLRAPNAVMTIGPLVFVSDPGNSKIRIIYLSLI